MKWFISGGCGFIGRALVGDLLLNADTQVRIYDNMSVGKISDLPFVKTVDQKKVWSSSSKWMDKISIITGDILDLKKLKSAMAGADFVIHLAANKGVPQSVENPF